MLVYCICLEKQKYIFEEETASSYLFIINAGMVIMQKITNEISLRCSAIISPHSVTKLTLFLSTSDDGVYKAGKKRSEMRGAAEVQEDEDTQTEVPIDQVISKVSINTHILNKFALSH